ncbi:hypothetical protein BKA56DRAFT_491460, partial [Ilyonectria sp. MPI-CAGE-AT-0026]
SITLNSIIYSFRLMICDEYYRHHPPYTGEGDMCNISETEASTAKAVSVLGATVTINGVLNLIFANWSMKTFGLKSVLVQQLVGPTIRLGCQLFGVRVGGGTGIMLVQASQLLGVVGGSTGYVLVLTTFMSRVVSSSQQTMAFGRLHGAIMLGTAVAYLAGGIVSDYLGIGAAFISACAVMLGSIIYVIVALPKLPLITDESSAESGSILAKITKPFRSLLKTNVGNSDTRTYQRPLLALGVFCGVLATGFIPILLQMYSTNMFGFTSQENGYLMALTFGVRSIFLTLGFPVIIDAGRRWFSPKPRAQRSDGAIVKPNEEDESTPLLESANSQLKKPAKTQFDLWFLTASFFADAFLTAGSAYCQRGWHLYIGMFLPRTTAAFLPLASGSAPAAKGVVVSLCEPEERTDALAGIAMVEMLATVLTMTIFGFIFSALAAAERSSLVFFINGGLALVAAFVTLLVKSPQQRVSPAQGDDGEEIEEED